MFAAGAVMMMQTPKVSDLTWISGPWRGEMFGGQWEELWSQPTKNAVQGHGRLIIDGETKFMEFMSIEADQEGNLVLYMIIGAPSRGEKKPRPFPLRESGEKRLTFCREGEDYPQSIEYRRDGERLICELNGTDEGKPKTEKFDFKKLN